MTIISGKIIEVLYNNEDNEEFMQRFIVTPFGNMPIQITEDTFIEIKEKMIISKKEIGNITITI